MVVNKPENIHSNYEVSRNSLEVLKHFKFELGIKMAVLTNSSIPFKRVKAFEGSTGFPMNFMFDAFITYGDVGFRKPSVDIMTQLLSKFPDVKPHEAFMVGDQLDRDIACARMAGVRSVFYGVTAASHESN